MSDHDELTEFERLVLAEGVRDGCVVVTLFSEGRPVEAAAAIKAQVDEMVTDGFLVRGLLSGSKARMAGTAYVAKYYLTRAGRLALAGAGP